MGANVLIIEQENVTRKTCNHAMTISDTENTFSAPWDWGIYRKKDYGEMNTLGVLKVFQLSRRTLKMGSSPRQYKVINWMKKKTNKQQKSHNQNKAPPKNNNKNPNKLLRSFWLFFLFKFILCCCSSPLLSDNLQSFFAWRKHLKLFVAGNELSILVCRQCSSF